MALSLGAGGAGVHAACRRCLSSSSLSYSAGPVFSSFSAETLALVHGLEWCYYHLKTCHFQSALFQTDSQLACALLSMAPAFSNKSPSGIFETSSISYFLSFHIVLCFQQVLSHPGLPGNELADSPIKTKNNTLLRPAKIRHIHCMTWNHGIYRTIVSIVDEIIIECLMLKVRSKKVFNCSLK